ncbi:MAG: GWxTD domain-containing protein [Candidatus Moduliflexus flocculans]|nr:GWxTD domain-containing protein [Candidatus Moduliflexus flocculans]
MLTPKRLVPAILVAAAALAATGLFAAKPKLDPESEKFYRTARLIMTKEENRIFLRLPDVPSRKEFIEDFWLKRDPDPDTPLNEYRREFEARVDFVGKRFNKEGGPRIQHRPGPGLHFHGPPGQDRGVLPPVPVVRHGLHLLVELLRRPAGHRVHRRKGLGQVSHHRLRGRPLRGHGPHEAGAVHPGRRRLQQEVLQVRDDLRCGPAGDHRPHPGQVAGPPGERGRRLPGRPEVPDLHLRRRGRDEGELRRDPLHRDHGGRDRRPQDGDVHVRPGPPARDELRRRRHPRPGRDAGQDPPDVRDQGPPPEDMTKGAPSMRRPIRLALLGLALLAALPAAAQKPNVKDLAPRFRQWLDLVAYHIQPVEKDVFMKLTSDRDRDVFVETFWKQRDPTPGTPENEYRDELVKRFKYCNEFYGRGTTREGWKTDMGRIHMILGPPASVEHFEASIGLVPCYSWSFYGDARRDLPPQFYLLFYQRGGVGEFKLYDPVTDGPSRLLLDQKKIDDPFDYGSLYENDHGDRPDPGRDRHHPHPGRIQLRPVAVAAQRHAPRRHHGIAQAGRQPVLRHALPQLQGPRVDRVPDQLRRERRRDGRYHGPGHGPALLPLLHGPGRGQRRSLRAEEPVLLQLPGQRQPPRRRGHRLPVQSGIPALFPGGFLEQGQGQRPGHRGVFPRRRGEIRAERPSDQHGRQAVQPPREDRGGPAGQGLALARRPLPRLQVRDLSARRPHPVQGPGQEARRRSQEDLRHGRRHRRPVQRAERDPGARGRRGGADRRPGPPRGESRPQDLHGPAGRSRGRADPELPLPDPGRASSSPITTRSPSCWPGRTERSSTRRTDTLTVSPAAAIGHPIANAKGIPLASQFLFRYMIAEQLEKTGRAAAAGPFYEEAFRLEAGLRGRRGPLRQLPHQDGSVRPGPRDRRKPAQRTRSASSSTASSAASPCSAGRSTKRPWSSCSRPTSSTTAKRTSSTPSGNAT